MINKKIFYLVISLSISESVNAVAIGQAFIENQTKLQIDRFFQKILKEREEQQKPLIAFIAEGPSLFRSQLVDMAFTNFNFTARDAHWAIEKYQTKEDIIFEFMLANKQMEDLLTEYFGQESNLLIYCLTHGYDEIYAKIRQTFPRVEANPQVGQFQATLGAPFRRALEQAINDPSMPLLGHLIHNNDSRSHGALIKHGLLAKKFTNLDLMWLIKEFSQPEKLTKDLANRIFGQIFNEHLSKEQENFVIGLLSVVNIPKENSYLSGAKQWLHGHSHSEFHNILVECIELQYLKALEEILSAFPKIDPSELKSVTRKEYVSTTSWFGSYTYQDANYSLISWLMRGRTKKQVYLKGPLARPHYQEAGRIIHKIFKLNYDQDNEEALVDPIILDLNEILTSQNEEILEKQTETKQE